MTAATLTAVRAEHRIDEQKLAHYLEEHQQGFKGLRGIRQFEGGQSNPTFLLEAESGRYVLRKQPPGHLLPSAHQVDREYRVMDALRNSRVPVPKMHCLCLDASVIGGQFYVMDFVDGRIFSDATLPGVAATDKGAVFRDLARVLAELHRVDPQQAGLGEFGRPGNYFSRQISRWTKQYAASATEDIAAMTQLMKWLPENVPDSQKACIVHGDYRIGNCLIHPVEPRIAAVIDWELATLGDPLADVGYVCQAYDISAFEFGLAGKDLATLGIPTRDEFVAEYCRHAGIERLEHLEFSIIYNLYRLAGISEGVYRRGLDGNASSAQALRFKGVARQYAETAWRMVEAL